MRLEVLKVLIVDDNHHMRVLLSEVLRAVGLQNIYEAGDGAEALHARGFTIALETNGTLAAPVGIDSVSYTHLTLPTKRIV